MNCALLTTNVTEGQLLCMDTTKKWSSNCCEIDKRGCRIGLKKGNEKRTSQEKAKKSKKLNRERGND